MHTKNYRFFGRKSLRTTIIVVGSMTAAFALGIETAGDVRTVPSTRASDTVIAGDLNADTVVDALDATAALEIARGLRVATPDELVADPNGDFHITDEDVSTILELISHQH